MPRALADDPPEVAWALDTARTLTRAHDHGAALVWLRRAAQSAAVAELDDRAVELAASAERLGNWLHNQPNLVDSVPPPPPPPPPSSSAQERAAAALKRARAVQPVGPPRSTMVMYHRTPAGLTPAGGIPAVRGPLASGGANPPPLPKKRRGGPPPVAASSSALLDAPKPRARKSVAPPKNTDSAPKPADSSAPARRRSSKAPALNKRRSGATVPPSAASSASARRATKAPPAASSRAGRTRRPPPAEMAPLPPLKQAPQALMRPKVNTLLFDDVLPPSQDVDTKVVERALQDCRALDPLSRNERVSLTSSAQLLRPRVGEDVMVTGLVLVVSGELALGPAVGDATAITLRAGEVLRGQATVPASLALRGVASSAPTVVLRWSATDLAMSLGQSVTLERTLRHEADPKLAACGATLGAVAEELGQDKLIALLADMTLKRLAPGEVLVAPAAPLPGVCVVGLGSLEGEGSERFGPGDAPFLREALERAAVPSGLAAGARGALVWLATSRAAISRLHGYPELLALSVVRTED